MTVLLKNNGSPHECVERDFMLASGPLPQGDPIPCTARIESQAAQPHLEDSSVYRPLRPTLLDKIKNFRPEVRARSVVGPASWTLLANDTNLGVRSIPIQIFGIIRDSTSALRIL